MDFFYKALASKHSTIIHGHFGRYPYLTKFYLDSIPELEPISDEELLFWYRPRSQSLHVLLEPPFDAKIPTHIWTLVLSSHLHLQYNASKTQVIHVPLLIKHAPLPVQATADQLVVLPPLKHTAPFHDLKDKSIRVNLASVENTHEAYLRLLTLYDALQPTTQWSLSIPERLRQDLMKVMKEYNFSCALQVVAVT